MSKSDNSKSSKEKGPLPSEENDVEVVNLEDGEDQAKAAAGPSGATDKLKSELEQARNDYLYLRAEFDNYRKNVLKERSDLMKYGSENLLRELLNVLDIFDSALGVELTTENLASFRQGFEMVSTELKSALTRFGVKEDNPLGQAFDPNQHEALSSEESSTVPAGHITRVFKKAFRLHDKLIRPAQVVVARDPSNTKNTD